MTLEQLRIAPMSQREAEEIAEWRYDPLYDFYDSGVFRFVEMERPA